MSAFGDLSAIFGTKSSTAFSDFASVASHAPSEPTAAAADSEMDTTSDTETKLPSAAEAAASMDAMAPSFDNWLGEVRLAGWLGRAKVEGAPLAKSAKKKQSGTQDQAGGRKPKRQSGIRVSGAGALLSSAGMDISSADEDERNKRKTTTRKKPAPRAPPADPQPMLIQKLEVAGVDVARIKPLRELVIDYPHLLKAGASAGAAVAATAEASAADPGMGLGGTTAERTAAGPRKPSTQRGKMAATPGAGAGAGTGAGAGAGAGAGSTGGKESKADAEAVAAAEAETAVATAAAASGLILDLDKLKAEVDRLSELAPDARVPFPGFGKEDAFAEPENSRWIRDRHQGFRVPVLISEVYGEKLSHTELMDRIRQKRVAMPTLDAVFENELLRASGDWPLADGRVVSFPACSCGDKCVGQRDGFVIIERKENSKQAVALTLVKTRLRFVLTRFMYPDVYSRFLRSGDAPSDQMPCVLCIRKQTCDRVLAIRNSRDAKDSKVSTASGTGAGAGAGSGPFAAAAAATSVVIESDHLEQYYVNTRDRDDGYIRDYMLTPVESKYEGLMGPIAMYRNHLLTAFRDHLQGGRPCVDQKAMIWKRPSGEAPGMGETQSHF